MTKGYIGDIGLLRSALDAAGFKSQSPDYDSRMIFNDLNKDKTWRRLKLWNGSGRIFDASQQQQRKLERELIKRFGDRILSMYFIDGMPWRGGAFCFCIRLAA